MKTKLFACVASLAGIFFTVTVSAQTIWPFGQGWWFKLGNATVSVISNRLQVSNLGASGEDGVAISLSELSRTAKLRFSPVNLTGAAGLEFGAYGMMNDTPGLSLGKLSLQRNGNVTELALSTGAEPWNFALRLEVYNQNALAGTVDVPANGVVGTLSGLVRLASVTAGDANPSVAQWTLWELEFMDQIGFSAPAVNGNRIRVVARNPGSALQNLMRLDVRARNLDSLVIEDVNAPTFQPRLRIARVGQRLQLRWDTRNVELQRAPTVNGPWTRVLEGTNTATISLGGANVFFRLRTSAESEVFPSGLCSLFPEFSLPGYVCKRNILLLIADDVGVDQIPWYINYYKGTANPITYTTNAANPATQMPTVAKLAASGVTFLNAWSSPVCSPTRACLFTGRHSFRHGIYSPLHPYLRPTIDGAEITTIANVLGSSSYGNGLFGKWHLGDTNIDGKVGPIYFGWDHFAGTLSGELRSYTNWDKVVADKDGSITNSTSNSYATTNNVEDTLNWINAQTGAWMATVAFNAPHSPWDWPPAGCAYQTRTATSDKAKYRSMLECLDRSMDDLLTSIPSNILEQTTIIFMGDNGTPISKGKPISDHFSVTNSKDSLYEGGVNVPLIIADGYTYLNRGQESPSSKGKGRVASPGRVETALVQTMDVFATAAEIGRGDASTGVDSVSMVPYLSSASAERQREVVFMETRTNSWNPGDTWVCGDTGWDVAIRGNVGISGESMKLIVWDYDPISNTSVSGKYELYNLTSDRWETNNLLAGTPSALPLSYKETLKKRLPSIVSGWEGCK